MKKLKLSESLRISHSYWLNANYSIKTLAIERGLPYSTIRSHANTLQRHFLLNKMISTDWKYDKVIIYSGIEEDKTNE